MEHKYFAKYLKWRHEQTDLVMGVKSDEYSSEGDKLHNFKRAGRIAGTSPEKALMGMAMKHLVSILDIIDKLDKQCGTDENKFPSKEDILTINAYMKMVHEKVGDLTNYMYLFEGHIIERYKKVMGGYPEWLNMEKN